MSWNARRRVVMVGAMAALSLLVALTASAAAPREASAATNVAVEGTIAPSYTGWARVRARGCHLTLVPGGSCSPAVGSTARAWRWNAASRTWTELTLHEGTYVYAWPYAGTHSLSSWHWAWTAQTGWLAMRTSSIYHAY